MIEKMTKYSFILLTQDKDAFLSNLRELGVVDITRSTKPVDAQSLALVSKAEVLSQRVAELERGSDIKLDALKASAAELRHELELVSAWGDWDPAKVDALKNAGVELHFYSIPAKNFKESWAEEFGLVLCGEYGGKLLCVIAGSSEGFPLKENASLPANTPDELRAKLETLENDIAREQEVLNREKENSLDAYKQEIHSLNSDLSLYLASLTGETAAEDSITVFVGFAPTENDAELAKAFDAMDCVWIADAATNEDNPPIKLRNNRFARLFEPLTGMYGMPVYGEWDPTPILSVFFLLFFAMCMGDAGYGLVLILYGILQDKKIVNIGMFDGLGKIIAVLGVATTVVGFFLGTAFGVDLTSVSWIPDSVKNLMLTGDITVGGSTYALQMVLALCIGIFHICLAMTVKACLYTQRFGFKANISTWGWLILILGGVITAVLAMFEFLPEDAVKIIVMAIGVISALAIFIFNTPGRNPLLNIGAGLWDTYNMATGILGDVLSYIRLYALGLAGGMLGGTFNTLGLMVLGDNPTWHWAAFAVILLFGHVLNLLMSCLGAFVHPLRLTFVEYFKNAGYEGKGRKYNALKK